MLEFAAGSDIVGRLPYAILIRNIIMLRTRALHTLGLAAVLGLSTAGASFAAGMNNAPPAGPVILDLAGTPVPHTFQQYTVSFVAASTTTDFSFAFREDPAFLILDDVSVTHAGGPNLVINGDFEAGPVGANAPQGWTYDNVYNSFAAGVTRAGVGVGGTNAYYDGSVQAYDAITQQLTTVVGLTYDVNFFLNDNGPLQTFSGLSTNGNTTGTNGNGIDLLVYAGTGIPVPAGVPLPASLPMFGAAVLAVAAVGYGRKLKGRASV